MTIMVLLCAAQIGLTVNIVGIVTESVENTLASISQLWAYHVAGSGMLTTVYRTTEAGFSYTCRTITKCVSSS